jgi:hypothetical protein
MARLLDVRALRGARLRSDPFAWARLGGVFRSLEAASGLREAFPSDGFRRSSRVSGDKQYELASRPLVGRGEACAAAAPGPWQTLAEDLFSPPYRSALRELTGIDVDRLEMEATFWRYEPGCWLGPHPDKPEKILSLVYYFNRPWEPGWGGALRVLGSCREDDVRDEVLPLLDTGVLLVRSDHSWHAVEPVREGSGARLTLQVAFYRAGGGPATEGGR